MLFTENDNNVFDIQDLQVCDLSNLAITYMTHKPGNKVRSYWDLLQMHEAGNITQM